MNLNVVVDYDGRKHKFVIRVGPGTQSFKWLALVAAQRLTMSAPRGRTRCRESADFAVSRSACVSPDDVYTRDRAFFHPEDALRNHLRDGDEVFVNTRHELPVDERGVPKLSKWAFIAFRVSEGFREERERLVEERMGELEDVRRQREREALSRRLERERPQIAKMREVMREQLHDEQNVRETMDSEWGFIVASGILDNLVPDHDERNLIRDFMTEKYSELSDMYKFYSAVNSGGGTHTLEYIEFNKFLVETNIFRNEDHSNDMLRIFLESHILTEKETVSAANIHSEIHQFEFFVTLIKIAVYKYITLTKRRVAMLKKKGHQASIAKASTPSPYEAVNMLYTEYLKPCIDTKPAGAAVRVSLGSDEVLLRMHENLPDLSQIFHLYSTHDPTNVTDEINNINNNDDHGNEENHHDRAEDRQPTPTPPSNVEDATTTDPPIVSGMMDIRQFGAFVSDAEFLRDKDVVLRRDDGTEVRNVPCAHLTVKDVRQIFSASQHDSVTNPEEIRLIEEGGDRDGHQEQMVFSEFLEGIARLGILKWNDGTYTKRIERALERACSLVRRRSDDGRPAEGDDGKEQSDGVAAGYY